MKKIISISITCSLFVLLLTACTSSKVPTKEEVYYYSEKELEDFAKSANEKELTKAWGIPQSVGNLRVWTNAIDGETNSM